MRVATISSLDLGGEAMKQVYIHWAIDGYPKKGLDISKALDVCGLH
jgi:hypothetical protein